jgi:hypothetical protein
LPKIVEEVEEEFEAKTTATQNTQSPCKKFNFMNRQKAPVVIQMNKTALLRAKKLEEIKQQQQQQQLQNQSKRAKLTHQTIRENSQNTKTTNNKTTISNKPTTTTTINQIPALVASQSISSNNRWSSVNATPTFNLHSSKFNNRF